GAAWCWGDNAAGQLGADPRDMPFSATPRAVADVPAFAAIAAGGGTTCAIAKSDKSVFCWGANDFAQLGRGGADTDAHFAPAPVQKTPDGIFTGADAITLG